MMLLSLYITVKRTVNGDNSFFYFTLSHNIYRAAFSTRTMQLFHYMIYLFDLFIYMIIYYFLSCY